MLPDVRKAWEDCLDMGPLNASSAHSGGVRGRMVLERARDVLCSALGADDPENVVFVSGGTEANNIVVNGFAKRGSRIVYSSVEHASVVEPAEAACEKQRWPVDGRGILEVARLEAALGRWFESEISDRDRRLGVLVCVQAANSETGVIQPLDQIAAVCREAPGDVYLHVDASQAFGRIRLDVDGVDSLSFSGHKLHAPQGTGFLWMSDRMAEVLPRTVRGGGQERGFRSGTQNVPGVAGLAAAIDLRFDFFEEHVSYLRRLRDGFEKSLLAAVPGASIVCADAPRLPNTTNAMFPGADAMEVLATLDAEGLICSNGSACSSMKPSASAVLRAIGLSEPEAFNCLRFSFSILNNEEEIAAAVPLIAAAVSRARAHA